MLSLQSCSFRAPPAPLHWAPRQPAAGRTHSAGRLPPAAAAWWQCHSIGCQMGQGSHKKPPQARRQGSLRLQPARQRKFVLAVFSAAAGRRQLVVAGPGLADKDLGKTEGTTIPSHQGSIAIALSRTARAAQERDQQGAKHPGPRPRAPLSCHGLAGTVRWRLRGAGRGLEATASMANVLGPRWRRWAVARVPPSGRPYIRHICLCC